MKKSVSRYEFKKKYKYLLFTMDTNPNYKLVLTIKFTLVFLIWSLIVLIQGVQGAMTAVTNHWEIATTMIFGSFIAGGTSSGGGAVAFPVLTKVLAVNPMDAKIFSLAIQSVGMTMASITIIALRIKIMWAVVFWSSFGGIFGIIIGAAWLSHFIPPTFVQVTFTTLVTSFAIVLFRVTKNNRPVMNLLPKDLTRIAVVLFVCGVCGGIVSGLVGNGIDIIIFSILVLYYKLDEKISTANSVLIMAINSIVGFALHYWFIGGFDETVKAYWLAAIPVVIVGAPLGAIVCSFMNRILIVRVLICLIGIEFITTLYTISFTNVLVIYTVSSFLLFVTFYNYINLPVRVNVSDSQQ